MSKGYTHKEIPKITCDSFYFNRNDESLPLLKAVYDGQIPYTSDFYPMLINNIERLYKGATSELQKFYPSQIQLTETEYRMGHRFSSFIPIINKYIPVSKTEEGYTAVLDWAKEVQDAYTSTRFFQPTTLEDFRRMYRRYEIQTQRIYAGYNQIAEKERSEQEDDLSKW